MIEGLAGSNLRTSALGLKEIIGMLSQGMSPEDLIAQGVPEALVNAALQQIMMTNQRPEGQGLASTVVSPV